MNSFVNPAQTVANFYNLALAGAGLLAFGFIVWGAIKYTLSAGNPGQQSDARDTVLQALLGLLLLVGAYLILNTINPALTSLKLPPLEPIQPPAAGGPPTGPTSTPGPGLNDAETRNKLLAADIAIKPGVNLESMQQSTIDELISLKNGCGCSITVTAGSDGVHQTGGCSHYNGCKVDLRLSDNLTNYIKGNFPFTGVRSDGAKLYKDPRTGATYAEELGSEPHWDVSAPTS